MTVSYGITSAGFVRKHLSDIVSDIQDSFKAAFGVSIRLDAKSIFGRLVGCFSQPLEDVWEVAEAVFNSFYPSSAKGVGMDGCLELVGLKRLSASASQVSESMGGDIGVTIPAGSIVQTSLSGQVPQQFKTLADVTISASSCVLTTIAINTAPSSGVVYTVTINGVPYAHTASGGDTSYIVLSALAALIEASGGPVSGSATPSILLVAGMPLIDPPPFTVAVSSTLKFVDCHSLVSMECLVKGPVPAYGGTLTDIQSSISGWRYASNPADAILGRDTELDSEARIRREQSLAKPGAGTLAAIRAGLGQVKGVTRAAVYRNNGDVADADGWLPHSVTAVVTGGLDADIAACLWDRVDAGDGMNGDNIVDVVDAEGTAQHMKFYRPTEIPMWVDVLYSPAPKETMPSNAADLIKLAIVAFGNTLTSGQDVIPERFCGAIYTACPGIGPFSIQVAPNSGGSPGSWTSTIYTVSKMAFASFDVARVSVAHV